MAWCRARGLRPLPAHPWTVAAYLRWCEARHRYPAILNRLRVIARAHLLKCQRSPDRHPTVMRTLRLIETRERALGARGALFPADEIVGVLRGGPTADPRHGEGAVRRQARRRLRGTPRLVIRRPATR